MQLAQEKDLRTCGDRKAPAVLLRFFFLSSFSHLPCVTEVEAEERLRCFFFGTICLCSTGWSGCYLAESSSVTAAARPERGSKLEDGGSHPHVVVANDLVADTLTSISSAKMKREPGSRVIQRVI